MPVTPRAGTNSAVVSADTPVEAVPVNPNGGFITNPYTATEQGIGAAESLYVDPTGADPTLEGNGTTFALLPGQSWTIIPGQTTPTKVNAASSGHKFSVTYW